MSEKDSENNGILWVVGGLFVVVAVMLAVEHFKKPASREPAASSVAASPSASTQPNSAAPSAKEADPPTYDPQAVMESEEFKDIAPKLPPGVKAPGKLMMSRNPRDQMRNALKALILSQEIYSAETSFTSYATRMDQLKEMPVIPGVTVTLRGVNGYGYVAIATHVKAPGKRCALYAGEPPVAPATKPGVIGCD
ncbi:MAG TPA: hypothetical protein VM100_01715 [Longimicrobiales bacterium]|nr:hypothetical protein [Longimicrobiales bacterium]